MEHWNKLAKISNSDWKKNMWEKKYSSSVAVDLFFFVRFYSYSSSACVVANKALRIQVYDTSDVLYKQLSLQLLKDAAFCLVAWLDSF